MAAVAAARERVAREGEGLGLAQLAAEAAPMAGLDLQAEVALIDEADGLIARRSNGRCRGRHGAPRWRPSGADAALAQSRDASRWPQ
ncbi:MAG: hypothetical protein R3E68_14595 [Burkholderiaceae bacterium]